MKEPINLDFLHHVAIRVKDLQLSANWYDNVLELKKYQVKKWGEFPIFMISNKSGVALFPANLEDDFINPHSENIKIDHFAFHVNKENFEKAMKKYEAMGLEFHIKDHYYFDSIFTRDPDGHMVELTSIKVNEREFYK